MSRADLAARQEALVAALVRGGPMPPGFAPDRVRAASLALIAKRAGEIAGVWPALRVELGPQWSEVVRRHADTHPPQGAIRDGWDIARARPSLSGPAALELAHREAAWVYDGASAPRRRRAPHVRRTGRTLVVQVAGRVVTWSR